MNIVDSSGWLEYLTDGPNAHHFQAPLQDTESLIVPVIVLYEVFKVILRERGENDALQVVAVMQKATVTDISPELAIDGARLSIELGLPMADSLILSVARKHEAMLWTQDSDFDGLPSVNYIAK